VDYYQESPETDPQGPTTGDFRVLRGGGFFHLQRYVGCAFRYWFPPGLVYDYWGFRVVVLPKL
jgi:sulfatase modifying factor 1